MNERKFDYFNNTVKLINSKKKYNFEDEEIKYFVKTLYDECKENQKKVDIDIEELFSNDSIKYSFKSLTSSRDYVDVKFNIKSDVSFVNKFQIKFQTYYDMCRMDISFNNNMRKLTNHTFYFDEQHYEKVFKIIVKFLCEDIV